MSKKSNRASGGGGEAVQRPGAGAVESPPPKLGKKSYEPDPKIKPAPKVKRDR